MLYGKIKEYRALLTFSSWSDALAAERAFEKLDCPYSPIPAPRSLSFECNFAICFPLGKIDLVKSLAEKGVPFVGLYEATDNGFIPWKGSTE
ncbi:MAG: DUF3343 domain-containing protein [Desulfitobacterium hafniense]|nr:DUF3343 domain-containing protein [Desulfitobacterium hafniense]